MRRSAWNGVAAALASCLLGLGLARFAYTPLIPVLVGAHWFSPSQAAYLGAANIAGYLGGALLGARTARRVGVRASLRLFMVLTSASLFACSLDWGFAWYFANRLLAGFAAAVLMVTAAPSVLPLLPERHRGLAGGIIFTGIGIGIALSGTVTPVLLPAGLPVVWVALGAGGALLTAAAWPAWPTDKQPAAETASGTGMNAALLWLCLAYAMSAFAQVPAILFLADFVARGLGQGTYAGATMWAIFGAGAIAGPVVAGIGADRIGEAAGLRILWLAQTVAFLLLAWPAAWLGQAAASAVLGAGVPCLVVLILGRSQKLADSDAEARRRAWSFATVSYAAGQAVGAYGLAFLFARTGDYRLLFGLGAGGMVLALVLGEVCAKASGSFLQKRTKRPFAPGS